MKLKTVFIEREGQKVRINASDYDPRKHTLYGGEKAPPAPTENEKYEDELKDKAIAALKEHGIHRDRRTSLTNLQTLLSEVEQ